MDIQETISNEIKGLETTLAATQTEHYGEIQKRLDSLEERATAPDDQKVIDLESQLKDSEGERKALDDRIRLLEANPEAPERGQSRAQDTGPDQFEGWFIKDIDGARDNIRSLSRGETRALDSALFTGTGNVDGRLSVESADAFIDFVTEQSETLSRITTRRMNSNAGALDELQIGSRTLIAATEATAPAVADSITINRRSLSTVEVVLAEDLTITFLEDNIERHGVESHIAAILAKSFGTQLNDLFLNGDGTTVGFLAINEGIIFLARAEADVTDFAAGSTTTAQQTLSETLDALPNEYRSILDLAYIVPTGFAQGYADEFAARATSAGDEVFVNGFPALRYFGRQVIPDPHMSEATTGIESDDALILTPLSNLVHGMQRQFTVDVEWQPRKRVMEYTMTAKVDAQFASGLPFVLTSAIPAAQL